MGKVLEARVRALQRDFRALPEELERWIALSEEGGIFEKHHSQIYALSTQIRDLNARVEKEWGDGATDFEKVKSARLRCMAVQTLWNYFREKFLLRRDELLGVFLEAADAYAWACYSPMLPANERSGVAPGGCEPPLVTFHQDISQWALSRRNPYDLPVDKTGITEHTVFEKVRRALPIPIIGIPWQAVKTLPDLALIAHETGHIVEADFHLREPVAAKLREDLADSELCEGWSEEWRAEVFADLFACYAAGPSFVWALMGALPDSPDVARGRVRPSLDSNPPVWGKYPPDGLRMRLNLAALEWQGFADEAAKIRALWATDFDRDGMSKFDGDLPTVVRAFHEGAALPADSKALHGKDGRRIFPLKFDLEALEEKSVKHDLLQMQRLGSNRDARMLVAVGGEAGRDLDDATNVAALWKIITVHIAESRPSGKLGNGELLPTTLKTDELADILFRYVDDFEIDP